MSPKPPAGQWARALLHPVAKPLVFVLALLPCLWLAWAAASNQLGANPAETLIRALGDWTLRFLCLVLAITPLRLLTRTPAWARFRRMLGLWVFFYATLHWLAYAVFDMGLVPADILHDVLKRPFIAVGVLGWLVLALLAATSFQRAIRWLGGAAWQRLHRLVYVVAGLAVLHFFWMRAGKNNFAEVWAYAAVLACLLAYRLGRWWQRR